ncbi:MAG: rRNA pseudouridine synthase [Candidatus Omnitrophica bacterium]|nr:rRNA pseudouridine synthase [Candidatus Omnitrophota bacterium]
MRLQSFLSRAGISSRRSVTQELEAGKIKVNGEVIRIPSYPIFLGKDHVTYLDQEVKLSSRKAYFLFNKPRGVITTAKDTHGRKTVLDYFKNVKERIYPVGRLDLDTTGLLLLTNDGELAHKLMHPSFGVEKAYEALLDQEVSAEQISQLSDGVMIEGIKTSPCHIQVLNTRDGKSKVEIILHEGRKRQIRNMFQAIGIHVIHLHRKRYGPLDLRGLTPGKSRLLTDQEIRALYTAVAPRSLQANLEINAPRGDFLKTKQGGNRGREKQIASQTRGRVSGRGQPINDAAAREHRGHRLRRRDSFHRG